MVYSEWGAWQIYSESLEENSQNFKVDFTRTCVNGPNGGLLECDGNSRKTEHFSFSQTAESFNDANFFCKNNGGQLFGNVDGSTEQLDFVFSIVESTSIWLGVEFDDWHKVWRNLKGEDVSELIFWNKTDFYNSDSFNHVYLKNVGSKLRQAFVTSDPDEKHKFACNMFFSEWGEWGSAQVSNDDYEYMKYYDRQCVTGPEGGVIDCENERYKIESWLMFEQTKMSYYDAKDNCYSMGGQLFGDLDGSSELIDFITSKFDGEIWLAINSYDLDDHFYHINGRYMNIRIPWGPGMPSGNGKYVYLGQQKLAYDTDDFSQPRFSACQMIYSEMQMGWAPIIDETESHRAVFYQEECKPSPFGEQIPCYSEPKKQFVEYIVYVKEKKSYFEAVDYCRYIGGQLFGDLDGSSEQLEEFATKVHDFLS